MKFIATPASWLFTPYVANFISRSRDHYRRDARELTQFEYAKLRPYFPSEFLHSVRIHHATEPLRVPRLYHALRGLRLTGSLPLNAAAGITFVDTVVLWVKPDMRLLFHELVHAAQYARMGMRRFSTEYVRGFLASGSYEGIPLERQAYEMDERFTRGEVFSVWREIEA